MRSTRVVSPREEGSALIIALVFVTTISLIVAAVLSFADVGLRASKSYKEKARLTYAADGAIAAATKRYSTTGPCDNFTAPLVKGTAPAPDRPVNGRGLIVRCQGPPPAGSRATQPVNSLLSLGPGGISSTEELRLLGDVYSTTTVNTTATMVVQGQVSAVGSCDGPIQTAPPTPLHCSGAAPADQADASRGRDPDYTKAATVVPVRRPVPACPATGWLVTVPPGYYDDGAGLSALTSGSCSGKVVWFQPGTYYFDLTFRGGPGTWKVDDPTVDVVGGTPKGWSPLAATRPKLSVPGSCKTESDTAPFDGVQLIAGGGTRLEVDRGRMELCATPSASEQQIALFGLRDELATHVLESTNITDVRGFTSVLNAQTINETPTVANASATLGPDLTSASLTFDALRPGVPDGSVISNVSLLAKHQDTGDPVTHTVTADFPGSACGSTDPKVLPADGRLDLGLACGLPKPEDFGALKVTYSATLASGVAATVQLDGVVVEVAYRTPVTRKPTAVLGSSGFRDTLNALEIGDQPNRLTADADLTTAAPSASITLAGLGDPPLPASATVESAVLRVAHRDAGYTGGPKVTVPVGTCTDLPLPLRPGVTDDRIDLKACGLNTPAKLKGLTATFTATLGPSLAGLSRLDGMWLEVVSTGPPDNPPPAFRQASRADSTATDPSSTAFTNPDGAKAIAEAPASNAVANLTGAANSAAVTVNDFNRVPLPAGSKISSAKLRVAHQEDAGIASVRLAKAFPGGTCLPEAVPISASLTDPDPFRSADLALCGLNSPDQLAGLAATYSADRKTETPPPVMPSTAAEPVAFLNPEKGRSNDNDPANAPLTGSSQTASVKLSGYASVPLPAGSAIDNATLRIGHRETGDIAVDGVTAAVTFTGSTCAEPKKLMPRVGAAIETDTSINLRDCGLTDPAQLADLQVVYQVAGGGTTAEAFLDGVELAITYRPPAVDRLDGIELDIVFQAPTFRPLCAGCELVKVAPAPADTATRFVASGTVYAPSAGVDISMYGLRTQVLRRGVIASSIHLGLQPLESYKRATGAIPPEIVNFTAYPDRTLKPATAGPATGFVNPDGAKALREDPLSTADADLNVTNPASLDLRGFAQTELPDSASIDSAVLRVRHQDDSNTEVTVIVKVGVGAGITCVTQSLGSRSQPLTIANAGEDQIDLGPCNLDKPTKLNDVRVTYTVAKKDPMAPATAKLDGITLEVMAGPLVRASVTFDRAKATVQEWSALG